MTAAPHIWTLTGNLLAERTLEFSAWAAGKAQRATRESFQVGGKGINVVKMLRRLGTPATALCFTGGAAGAECRAWLDSHQFDYRSFSTTGATRIGVVVRSPGKRETTFMGPDSPPDAAAVRTCADCLDAQPAGQILAVCGSLPGWASADCEPLRASLQRWLGRGTLVADSYGPPLAWLVAQPLALVKINATELRSLFAGKSALATTPGLLKTAARGSPVRHWIVTDGGGPVWLLDQGGEPAKLQPPVVPEVSSTGSGDVLLACVLDSLYRRQRPLAEAVSQALPYAAANAAHPGVAEFPLPIA